MKKIISVILALFLCSVLFLPVFAVDYTFVADDLGEITNLDEVNAEMQKFYEKYGISFCFLLTEVADRESCDARTDALFIPGETIPDAPAIILIDGGESVFTTGLGGVGNYFGAGASDAILDAYIEAASVQEGISAYLHAAEAYYLPDAEYAFVVDDLDLINVDALNKTAQDYYERYGISFCFLLTEAADREACDEKIADTFILGETIPYGPAIILVDTGDNLYTSGLGGAGNCFEDDTPDRVMNAYKAEEYYEKGVLAYMDEAVECLYSDYDVTFGLPHMVDEAGLLTADERQALEETLEEISARQVCDVVIVTVDSLDGKTATAYADDYYDYNGYGQGSSYDGILFLLSMEDRDWAISTCGYGITAFTDYGIEQLFDYVKSDLADNEYYDAFTAFADKADEMLTLAHEGKPVDVGSEESQYRKAVLGPVGVIIALVLGFLIAGIPMKKLKNQINNVKWQTAASDYTKPGSMVMTQNYDRFLYANTTRRVIETESSSGGSRGGSSTHTSSSGRSHGGSSGKF